MKLAYVVPSIGTIEQLTPCIVCGSGDKELKVVSTPVNNGWGNSPARHAIVH